MEFRRLENSIKLNQTEEPSIYMALCMVETLFKDIKDATGQDISEVPAGDEKLPIKLVWVCRMVDKIYSKKSDTFTRSLQDLKEKRKLLLEEERQLEQAAEQISAEMEQYSSVDERLKACRAENAELEQNLIAARENYQIWQDLVNKCKEQHTEIAKLKQADPKKEQENLEKLKKEREQLSAQFQDLRKDNSKVKAEIDRLTTDCSAEETQKKQLKEQIAACQIQLDAQKKQNDALAGREKDLQNDLKQQQAWESALTIQVQQAEENLNRFRQQKILPLQDALEKTQSEYREAQATMTALKENLDTANEKRTVCILEVSDLRTQINKVAVEIQQKNDEIECKKKDLETNKRKRSQYELTYNAQVQALDQLQKENSHLEDEIKKNQERVKTEEQQKKTLCEDCAELEKLIEEEKAKNEELSKKQETLKQEYSKLEIEYNRLTADESARNEEIKRLDEQLRELRSKTDVEKAREIQHQKAEKIARFQKMLEDCEEDQRQMIEIARQIKNKNEECQNLANRRLEMENSLQDAERLLTELKPFASYEYLQRARRLKDRCRSLESVRRELKNSVDEMQRALGMSSTHSLGLDLPASLKDLQERLDKVNERLLNCANECEKKLQWEDML